MQVYDQNTPEFPSGFGQCDTGAITLNDGRPNPHKRAGTPYKTITTAEIGAMAENPQTSPKEQARWFIPSTYNDLDARTHEVQRQRGSFAWLTLDVDTNNLSLEAVDASLSHVIGEACRIIYSTRSATEENKKWRALVPLANKIDGSDFSDTQNAFFDLLEEASEGALTPDRALARPAQLVYLPNHGDFYQVKLDKVEALALSPDHAIIQHRDAKQKALALGALEARAARDKRKAKVQPGVLSPIGAYNSARTVAELLERYGYTQNGPSVDWRSPFQSSGSYATRDFGDYWISLSESDDAQGIGTKTVNGHRYGDAFALFVHFEHGGNFKRALTAYRTDLIRLAPHEESVIPHYDTSASSRSFESLLEAAKALDANQIDEMEAIVIEAAAFSPVRQDAVFRAIKNATKIPMGTIRAQLSQQTQIVDLDHLDLARATIQNIGGENLIYADGAVWRWQERGIWTEQDPRAIKQSAQLAIDEQEINVTANLVNGVSDVLKNEIFKPEHEFNLGHPETVNCLNGELELLDFSSAWQLEPHDREHYRTTQIPVAYDPEADAPLFRVFLEQVFRDDTDKTEKIRCVCELMGYTLMSHARHELFVMLIGPGANGKSVLLAIIEALVGEKNVAGVQPANFSDKFQRAHLHKKLANIVTELKQGEVIADAELKGITSGEPSTVENKHRDPFVLRPFSTCWFGTNHMPHTRDFSDALFRRAVILQFNRTFAKEEQDPQLKDKLLTELPGILNLALSAYANALESGFTKPSSTEAAKKEWRLEADQVAQFVDDACSRDPKAREKTSNVFEAYKYWAQENGVSQMMSHRGLRERLTRLGFGEHRNGKARYVTGLRIVVGGPFSKSL